MALSRARKVLEGYLDEEQGLTLKKVGYFDVRGPSGALYRLWNTRRIGGHDFPFMVHKSWGWRSACVLVENITRSRPPYQYMLTMLLTIKYREWKIKSLLMSK